MHNGFSGGGFGQRANHATLDACFRLRARTIALAIVPYGNVFTAAFLPPIAIPLAVIRTRASGFLLTGFTEGFRRTLLFLLREERTTVN